MQISQKELIFTNNQLTKSLILKNHSNQYIIFKIKTTNYQLLSAVPCRGFVEPTKQLIIQVKCNEPNQFFQAKLLIISASLTSNPQSFELSWSKIDPKICKQDLVILTKIQKLLPIKEQTIESSKKKVKQQQSDQQLSEQSNSLSYLNNQSSPQNTAEYSQITKKGCQNISIKNQINAKKTQSIYNSINSSKKSKQSPNSDQNHNKIFQTKPIREQIELPTFSKKMKKQKTSTFKMSNSIQQSEHSGYFITTSQPSHIQPQIFPQQSTFNPLSTVHLTNICQLQGQLLAQKQQNQRLKNLINRNCYIQRQRMYEDRQTKINSSLAQEHSNSQQINWPVLVLVSVVFFSIGIVISKI